MMTQIFYLVVKEALGLLMKRISDLLSDLLISKIQTTLSSKIANLKLLAYFLCFLFSFWENGISRQFWTLGVFILEYNIGCAFSVSVIFLRKNDLATLHTMLI